MTGPDQNNEPHKTNLWAPNVSPMSSAFNREAAKDRSHPDAERKHARSQRRRGPAMGGSRYQVKGKVQHSQASTPFSIRLTPAERERLKEDAGDEPLGAYVKKTLFAPTTKAAARRAMIDHHRVLIAQVLAVVGSSGIGDALTSMAVAIKMGTLANEAEALDVLNSAQDELAEIRSELLKALDIRKPNGSGGGKTKSQ